jgi:hypothetical protein
MTAVERGAVLGRHIAGADHILDAGGDAVKA